MKAVIISDIHGFVSKAEEAIEREKDASMVIFAGDVQRDIEELCRRYPQMPVVYVLGNNDWDITDVPFDRTFELGGKRVFLTHGHRYGVKSGLYGLRKKALEVGADICIFGHTHQSFFQVQDGIYMINPGYCYCSYAVLEIEGDKIKVEIK